MSGSGVLPAPAQKQLRHQVHRSLTELTSPIRLGKHHTHTSHHHSTHGRAHSRDHRSNMVAPQLAAPVLQLPARGSLELPRSGGVTPNSQTPNQSRRGSILIPNGGENVGGITELPAALSMDDVVRREREKAEARTTGLKKSLVDITSFSTTTTQHLDETYYNVLEKLRSLQNTILALKELATASSSTNDGFISESQSVLSEAQGQLDAFGQFDEQQARVQALQDRVHDGRERIATLSDRVDIVRQRVERWERADREWQEKTRRRLKIVWGVVLVLALVVCLLLYGARAYAPEIEEVARELNKDAVLAKMRLEGRARAIVTDGGDRSGSALNFSRDGKAEVGDEALRALDEL